MSKVWFTSDTHFGHQRTLELSRRPFSTIAEMNNALVSRWNHNVAVEDTVYHLGDFGKPEFMHRLQGARIFLLPGNYDTPETIETLLQQDTRIRIWGNVNGERAKSILMKSPVDSGLPEYLYLVHEPENAASSNVFYLYGHIHQLQMVKRNGLNVGVDCHQFHPIDFNVVKFYYDAITQHYDKNVFMPELGNKE